MNIILIILGKFVEIVSKLFNIGSGSTWPGHIALSAKQNFVKEIIAQNKQLKIILIAGTNGKTTTSKLIRKILEQSHIRVIHNKSGANLPNGVASALIQNVTISGKINADYAVFEVDENSLSLVTNELTPDFLIVLNLFRDQLDRYGETDSIAKKWQKVTNSLPASSSLILNADDPQISYLAKNTKAKVFYFGLDNPKLHQKAPQHATDSTYCPSCGSKLTYKTTYFSHSGDWECKNCGVKRPRLDQSSSPIYPLVGVYNYYNTHAAVLLAKLNNLNNETIEQSLKEFTPAFGRQETLTVKGKKVQLFLSKNPTSFNQSLRTITELKAKHALIALNDRIPDGRDVSWIWDVDTEELFGADSVIISGDRVHDMALRLKYSSSSEIKNEKLKIKNYNVKLKIFEDLKKAISHSLSLVSPDETLYVLPTYSAMLEVRKILTGKKIL
ncbi:MAG: Mur ligase family protein [Candidatus Levybacteria bacterium]|nr:Mur ligase family protein [Candidatus Levybacteria bacterium]